MSNERTRTGQLVAVDLVPPGPLFEEPSSSPQTPQPEEQAEASKPAVMSSLNEPPQPVHSSSTETERVSPGVGGEPLASRSLPGAPEQPPPPSRPHPDRARPPSPSPAARASKSLFSLHYLTHRIQEHPEWAEDISAPFAQLRALYEAEKGVLSQFNEAQTENEFIRPTLSILGFAYIPQTITHRAGRVQRPDYALFAGEAAKSEAYHNQQDESAFYARTLAIADAKYWERSLNEVSHDDPRDIFKDTNPSFQIVSYLIGTNVDWGILTNGRMWRIYYRQAASTATEFYEVDLVEMLESGDLEHFKYFWFFFRRQAFIKDAQGRNFLERVYEGSATYARIIGDRLKALVFEEVFPLLSGGFVAYGAAHGEDVTSEANRQLIYEATLSFLYKLLFLLYAESRNLLPIDNQGYRTQSLTHTAQEIAGRLDRKEPMGQTSTALYDRLLNLFRLVDQGDRGLGLPRYNGGLFHFNFADPVDREKHRANAFLLNRKMTDASLAPALDRLYRADGEPIDYGFIGVRHLGAIYEGLLENKLRVVNVAAGQVELVNDKGERRATGSYYTPDYVVKYIAQHTIGPVLEERAGRFGELMSQIGDLRHQLADPRQMANVPVLREKLDRLEHQARETLLDIKVCDPAMGSGHFLVEAVDFLTDGLIGILNQHPEHNPVLSMLDDIRRGIVSNLERQGIRIDLARLDDTQLLQRVVMKRCIYGVDLNPMAVELAKVSLWLHSFTVGAPLSFLDHHLRYGNSLIGATAREANRVLRITEKVQKVSRGARLLAEGRGEEAREAVTGQQPALWGGPFAGLLQAAETMRGISLLSDATFAEVEESTHLFNEFGQAARPYKQLLDIYVSRQFGVNRADEFLRLYGSDAIRAGPETVGEPYAMVIREAHRLYEEKRFFHWDLEFPEVFIDLERATWKEKPGFDVVIGNPPYSTVIPNDERRYLESAFPKTSSGYKNTALHFVELGCEHSKGLFGFIVPKSVTYSEGWHPAVEILWPFLTHAADASRAWEEVLLEMVVLIADLRVRSDFYSTGQFIGGRIKEAAIEKARWERFAVVITSATESELRIVESAWRRARPMGEVVHNYRGVGWQHLCVPNGPIPAIRGDAIARYQTIPNTFLPNEILTNQEYFDRLQRYRKKRVVAQNVVAYVSQPNDHIILMAALVEDDSIPLDTVNNLVAENSAWRPEALLALINSTFMSWYAYRFVYNRAIRTMHFDEAYTDKLPMPNIAFTTPPDARMRYLEEAKALYGHCLTQDDQACILGFVDHHLDQRPEQSDVVHDLLAYLAEQMIKMNKQKQAEVKGFLAWLEREVCASVDNLRSKSRLHNYPGDYRKNEVHLTLAELLDILRQNRTGLRIDPTARAFQQRLEQEYQDSLNKLLPLKASLAATDHLIDLVVYRLYGLTDGEISIVEGRTL